MRTIYLWSIRRPVLTLVLAGLATLALVPGMLRLRLRTDGHALVPHDAPEIEVDARIRKHFGIKDQVAICIRTTHPDGIFNVETLRLVHTLSKKEQETGQEFGRLAEIEGISPEDITSLATEKSDRVYTGRLKFRPFLDPLPETPEELSRLREDLRALRLFDGALVSYDGKSTTVLVGVDLGDNRIRVVQEIKRLVAELNTSGHEIHVVGAPVAEALLGHHILEDLSLLVPLAVLTIGIVLYLLTRNLWGVVLPLAEVGACLLSVFGLMGYLDVPIYLTMAVMPVILTTIGVADEIHVFYRYQSGLRAGASAPHPAALIETMDEMWRPVIKTSLTTGVGFCSFAFSPIEPVRQFGLFTTLGVLICMVWTLTVIPASLSLLGPERFLRGQRASGANTAGRYGWIGGLGRAAIRLRGAISVVAAVLLVLSPLGLARPVVEDGWIDGFAKRSEFYQATQQFNRDFHGAHILLVQYDPGPLHLSGEVARGALSANSVELPLVIRDAQTLERLPRCGLSVKGELEKIFRIVRVGVDEARGVTRLWTDPKEGSLLDLPGLPSTGKVGYRIGSAPNALHSAEVLDRIRELEVALRAEHKYGVGGVLGTNDYMITMRFMYLARREGSRKIERDQRQLDNLYHYYNQVRGRQRRQEVMGLDDRLGLITVFLKNANFVDTARLMENIRAYEARVLTPVGAKLEFGGDVAVSQAMIPAIVRTQVLSIGGSLLGILLVTALLFRSIGAGLLCMIPASIAIVCNYAAMGLCNVPLGVATSMFCGMTLGMGVDYAIHLVERCRLTFQRSGDVRAGIVSSVAMTGPAVVIDAVAIALGFGVMLFSSVPTNARLAGLLIVSILGCLAATLVLLPALLAVTQPGVLRRELRIGQMMRTILRGPAGGVSESA